MHSAESTHCNPKATASNIDDIPVHHITQSAPVSKSRLQELRLATQSDLTLNSLTKTVHGGWPQSRKDCPELLLDFWSFRQEISEEDRLLYKNHRLIMPHSERLKTLKVLHLGHYAIDKMQLRALATVYWPGINKDILRYYQSCKTCIKYSKSQRSEPLQSHPTPAVPWHTVSTHLFETKNSRYLLIVDYYSRFPILHKLNSTTSRVLIQEMKAVFAKLGVPNVIVSDGGPQYTSAEFQDLTKHWQIEHRVSSPRNPQSNGMAEHYVQTMKASPIKTIEEGEDVDLALLTYKTTALNHRLPSPAELLNSRKYKTLLPTCIVPTRLQETYRQITDKEKQMQAQLYNRNTRVLPRLKQSQKVVVQLDLDKNIWTPAQIIQCPVNEGRSYSLRTKHSGIYTRNRRFIKPDLTEAVLPESEPGVRPLVARPTRTTKKPDRLIESKLNS